ncbi:LOW QUALITY PROTEIN: taste receptor type 2 member 9 [Glossophaga mutica]
MPSTMKATYMILIAGELTVGIGNGFFLYWLLHWLRRKDSSWIDIILVSVALSRICLLCVIFLDGFVMLLSPDSYAHGELMNTLDVLCVHSYHSRVWFISHLNIFYLLRIVDISHPFFHWLKLKIKIILGILLISFLISLIISASLTEDSCYHFKVNYEENITWEFKVSKIPNPFKEITLNLGAIAPFILYLMSFLLLLCSFLSTRQMKLHAVGSRDASAEARMWTLKGSDHLSAALYYAPHRLSCHNLSLSDSSDKTCGDFCLHNYCHFSTKASTDPDNGEQ